MDWWPNIICDVVIIISISVIPLELQHRTIGDDIGRVICDDAELLLHAHSNIIKVSELLYTT